MNKNQYRIVFNARRGIRMAVAETATSQGKSASGESRGAGNAAAGSRTCLLSLAGAMGVALFMQTALLPTNALAQVVADRSAPGNQQATILQTASGITQVNIQTPSAAGVSRNTYSQFDVQKSGVILNNARTDSNTQIGGYVQGNPWLSGASARVILNEVNSAKPSQLNGYVEVAGQRAEVIIANPAGIAVNGGGFLNASGVTLTTGTPVVNGGNLESYRVRSGSVTIDGAGLDTSTADYTNILTRAATLNAGIWAKNLKIVTGLNQIDATNVANPAVIGSAGTGTDAAPAFALDVAQLGGMYAGKIFLMGTEAGLGVRNSGVIGATAGDVSISNNGWLSNSGTLSAVGNTTVSAQGDITNTGDLVATGTTSVSSTGVLTNRGLIDSGNDSGTGQTRIDAATVNNLGTGRIYGDTISVAATTLNNDAETVNGTTTAATLAARQRLAMGVATLNNLNGSSILSLGDMTIGGSLDANRQATGSATTLTNSASTIEAQGALTVRSAQINNLNPTIEWTADAGTTGASGTLYFTPQGTFDSAQGALLASSGWTAMAHGGYAYQITEYVTCGSLGEFAVCGNNPNALVPMTRYGQGSAQQNSSSGAVTFSGFASYTQTDYKAVITKSTPGRIASGGDMTLVASQGVVNDQSAIVAGGALTITSPSIDNRARTITLNSVRNGTAYNWSQYDYGCGNVKGCDYNYQAYAPSGYTSTVGSTQVLNISVSKQHSTDALSSQGTTLPVTSGNSLPTSSLYRIQSGPSATVLVQTDPRFTNYKAWLGSDYMTSRISLDPSVTQKRLGDGFYEQQLIREQVAKLTGNRFLGNYSSDQQEYQALMDAGLTYASAYNLRPGIALSAAQVAQLTSDIVWLQQESVTLPDGSITQALVPHVYLALRDGDLVASGALLSGKSVNLATSQLHNSGTIQGRELVQIEADTINNLAGQIKGKDVVLRASQDINNVGGTVMAQDTLSVSAGRDLNVVSTTQSTSGSAGSYSFSQSGIDRVAGLYVTNSKGVLLASAGNDMNIIAAQMRSAGDAQLQAGGNVNLGTVQQGVTNNFGVTNADNHLLTSQTREVGTQISAVGNVSIRAGQDVNARAVDVQAGGDLGVSAGNNVNIIAGQKSTTYDRAEKRSTSDLFSSTTITQRDTNDTQSAVASNLGGANVTVVSQKDLTIKGSNVVADKDLILVAGNNVNIQADQNSQTSSHFYEKSESGLLSGGGVGISIGERKQSLDNKTTSTTAAASTVGATAGNVTIAAGKTYTQTGSDVMTPAGDIKISAQAVNIVEARETNNSSSEQKFSQSGVTLSISSPVVQAVQSIQDMGKAASQTKSGRMQALAAASAIGAGYGAYTAIDNGQGTNINGNKGQIATGTDVNDGVQTSRDATAADKAGGINISISLGSSSSQSKTETSGNTARGSTVVAKGTVDIQATGAAQDSNLLVQGSSIQAGDATKLSADNKVQLLAAANLTTQSSTNSNSAGSIGMSFGTNGWTVNVSASQGKGKGNGTDVSYTNTQVQAGKTVNIRSGGDSQLHGAVVTANAVKADVGGNLSVESLQDTSTYTETQSSSGFSVSIPVAGMGKASGSVSSNKTDINSNYQSASVQSGIQAGDGGFQVTVQGNTDLKGGLIASSDSAIQNQQNKLTTGTLTTSDLQNQASASVNSSGFSVGTDMLTQGKYGLTKGVLANGVNNASQSGNSSGQTRSAISAGTVIITDDAAQTQLTGKTGAQTIASLNRDSKNANTMAQRQDVQAMKQTVQAEQAIKNEAVKQITTLTDEAYRVMFQTKPKFYKVTCQVKDCVANPDKVVVSLIDPTGEDPGKVQKMLADAPSGSVLAVNGIDNPLDRAGQLAMQNAELVTTDAQGNLLLKPEKPSTIYLMHYEPANNGLSELLIAGYEKKLAPTLGYSNQDQAYAAGLQTLGSNTIANTSPGTQPPAYVSQGHSRGTIVQTNANNIVADEGVSLPNLRVQGVGGAVTAQDYTHAAVRVVGTESIDNVKFSYFATDPVSVVAGGNPGVFSLSEFWQVLKTSNSVHSCYGTGAEGCKQVQILAPNAPEKAVQNNSNLVQYIGGKPYDGNMKPLDLKP